jgi:hypothetical protein
MRKIKESLVLYDISSTTTDPLAGWRPETLEDTYTSIDLTIGTNDKSKGINYFYVTVATPEALRLRSTGFLISDHRVIVIEKFDFKLLKMNIEKILEKCNRSTWSESCLVLQRYFAWEYEDYKSA